MKIVGVLSALAVIAICSCSGDGLLLPKSGGRPYEVLVVSVESGRGAASVDSVLSLDVPGLPQSEPMFDVSLTDSAHFNQTAKLARSIVVVNVNPHLFTTTRIRYEKNVWARPQIVAYVNAASDSSLLADMPRIGTQLANLLVRAEMNAAISQLGGSANVKASGIVAEMFGYGIKIPSDMKSYKAGRNFVWLSDDAPSGMQSICVYSYPGNRLDALRALAVRDSVMKANIPGERRGMYMQTAASTVVCGFTEEKGRTVMVSRGLWEMHGDAMGGPFVAHSVVDTAGNRVVVAEAFVYAPETKKRNLLRQAEAALYTLKKIKH